MTYLSSNLTLADSFDSSSLHISCLIIYGYLAVDEQDKGHAELYKHDIALNADRITATDAESIPTGEFTQVFGSAYDFRVQRNLGDAIAQITNNGFDDNFCITNVSSSSLTFIAR